MPLVTVKAGEGRTIEQKRALVKDITEDSKENLAKAGQLFIDR
jgi:phenylpyruvate tautomerase PptA (4-oxalocrotonate tautomerase family)